MDQPRGGMDSDIFEQQRLSLFLGFLKITNLTLLCKGRHAGGSKNDYFSVYRGWGREISVDNF